MTVRAHVKKHKTAYVSVVTGVVVAGITVLIMRSNIARGEMGSGITRGEIANTASDGKPTYWAHQSMKSPPTGHIDFAFSNSEISNSFNNVVNVLEREGRGHPGYMIRCVEDNLGYTSQKDAAFSYGAHQNRMSDHLNGRLENVGGKHFERVSLGEST